MFSDWQVARPSTTLGLAFDSSTFQVLVKWHLVIPLLPIDWTGAPYPLGCNAPIDANGDHIVTCRKAKAWQRHQCIQSFMARCFRQAGIPHRLEVSILGDQKRDADILCPQWESGAGWAIDFECAMCAPVHAGLFPAGVTGHYGDTRPAQAAEIRGQSASSWGQILRLHHFNLGVLRSRGERSLAGHSPPAGSRQGGRGPHDVHRGTPPRPIPRPHGGRGQTTAVPPVCQGTRIHGGSRHEPREPRDTSSSLHYGTRSTQHSGHAN